MILDIIATLILVIIIPLGIGLPPSISPNPRNYSSDETLFGYWLNGVGFIFITLLFIAIFFGICWSFVRVLRML